MKRHESLHALSQHHHFALMESLFIRRADEESAATRDSSLRKVAEEFIQFWEKKGKLHFREEEEILIPAYALHFSIENDQDVMRMLADHAMIRAKIGKLISLLSNNEAFETNLTELGEILQNHVRLEEDVIFPRMEKTLTEEELQKVGHLLTWLHPKGSCEL
ncbi:hemerythrin domain-containing protein [bacterium]|nr:hemerythrin domain-containing protein [bacterium]MCI0612647.1 hemerythrin domain-containing protein [bacterium]